uniref:Uncharacterized protein n=1 Tax=Anguilla anguilla TaxID=7936 RepID=A0A0E9VML8_ANGAN
MQHTFVREIPFMRFLHVFYI